MTHITLLIKTPPNDTLKFYFIFFSLLCANLLHSQQTNVDSIPTQPMNSFAINFGDASGIIDLNSKKIGIFDT